MTDLNATWNEALRGPRMSEATGRVIFKYQMPVLEEFTMELPKGAEIIRMEDQGGMFWLWAVVNTDAPMEKRFFRAFKTGAKMPDGVELKYVGFCAVFVQMELGLYIFEDVLATQNARAKTSVKFKGDGMSLFRTMTGRMYEEPAQVELTQEMRDRFTVHTISDWPEDGPTYREVIQGVDTILGSFKDVINYKGKPNMNQTMVDIEEARMEDED